LIERIVLHVQATSLHTSGLSQMLVQKVLQNMGVDGFFEHVKKVASFYKDRCEFFIKCLEKHLTGKAEWNKPDSGMFVWIKLLGIDDSFDLISKKAKDAKVLLVPGQEFYGVDQKSNYVRASFSIPTQEEMEEGIKRLASLLN
jgi:kynurenine/2-aminoadipate aminotransferase